MTEQFCQQYPEHKEELLERCAIMEFSGNMPRKYAEEAALKLIRGKYDLYKQGEMF